MSLGHRYSLLLKTLKWIFRLRNADEHSILIGKVRLVCYIMEHYVTLDNLHQLLFVYCLFCLIFIHLKAMKRRKDSTLSATALYDHHFRT